MKLTRKALLISLFLSLSSGIYAQTTFSFHDGANAIGTGLVFDDEAGSIQDTQGSFTITAEAFLNDSSTGSFFNGTTAAFGINAAGSGDATAEFDDDNGTESMVFSFNIGGTFTSLDLVGINNDDEATLSFAGGGTYNLSDATDDFYVIGESFTSGQLITLSTNATGANFGLEAFTVVPEPGSFALIAGCLGMASIMLKRRHD